MDADLSLAHELCETVLVVWYEIEMTHRHNYEAVDRTLCGIFQSTLPFGGIVILRLVHFRQNLPVVRVANKLQIVSACFKRFRLYSSFKCLHLYNDMRLQALCEDFNAAQDVLEFPYYLTNLGEEKLQS